jgi:uncharacterized membrane protein
MWPLFFAVLSATCFGLALVTRRVGLRWLDPRSAASISIPSATVLLLIAAPFSLGAAGFDLRAALLFAAIGLAFPAVVTLLTFRANELLGPTITGAVSGTAPLFALAGAGLLLGKHAPARAAISAAGIRGRSVPGSRSKEWRGSQGWES